MESTGTAPAAPCTRLRASDDGQRVAASRAALVRTGSFQFGRTKWQVYPSGRRCK